MPTLLVPGALVDKDVTISLLKHPKTGLPTKFVVDGESLYQLLVVDPAAHPGQIDRSILLTRDASETASAGTCDVYKDGGLSILVPVNPVFLFASFLHARPGGLPLDILLQLMADETTDDISSEFAAPYLAKLCDVDGEGDDAFYTYSAAKTDAVLVKLVEACKLPRSLLEKYEQAVTPLNPLETIDPGLLAQIHRYASYMFVGSWLSPELAAQLHSLLNFSELHSKVDSLQAARAQAFAIQTLQSKRDLPAPAALKRKAPAAPSKSSKKVPTNNKSILDMFKRINK